MRISTTIYRSVDDLATASWDEGPRDDLYRFYRSVPWLRSVAGGLSADEAYVVARDDDGVVGTCVASLVRPGAYSLFDARELVFGRSAYERIVPAAVPGRDDVGALARSLASVADSVYPVATCVIPFGYVTGIASRDGGAGLDALLDAFDDLAQTWHAGASAVLYVPEATAQALRLRLARRGFQEALLAARCVMGVPRTFDDYLAGFRSGRRTSIRREIRAFEHSGLRTTTFYGHEVDVHVERLGYLSARLDEKYGHGFDPARETVALRRILGHLGAFARTIVVVSPDDVPVAFHTYFEYGDVLYAGLVGQDYDAVQQRHHAHFHALYYEPLRRAQQSGARMIDYRIEAYATKVSRGCGLQPLSGFFRFAADAAGDVRRLLSLQSAARRRELSGYRRLEARGPR